MIQGIRLNPNIIQIYYVGKYLQLQIVEYFFYMGC